MYTKQLLSKLTLPDFNQLQRSSSSSAISERTLEECWTTLQRVSWILFNRVAYSSSCAARLLLPACLPACVFSLGSFFCFLLLTDPLNPSSWFLPFARYSLCERVPTHPVFCSRSVIVLVLLIVLKRKSRLCNMCLFGSAAR